MKNIARMTLKELLATEAAVTAAITVSRQRQAHALIASVAAQARELGLSTKQLFKTGAKPLGTLTRLGSGKRWSSRKSPGKAAVKYRNKKTGETWTGRGRMANWLAVEVKKGRKKESFLV